MSRIDEYLEYVTKVRRYSPRTAEIYADVLSGYSAFCDAGEFGECACRPDVRSVRSFEMYLLDDRSESPSTVSQHLSVLSGFCRFLIKKGDIESNPVRLVPKPKLKKRIPEFYREESMREYFESTKGAVEFGTYDAALRRIIISLLYATGIRRSELISLNRDSVDFKRGVIRVLGKGDKMREVPVTATLSEELGVFLGRSDCPVTEALLVTPSGVRLYPVFVDRAVKRELGGMADITSRKSPHVLRHTLASELLGDGADLNSIKELLGHSSLAATQIYTHSSVERLKKVYDAAHPRAAKK